MRINLHLNGSQATLAIDLSGDSLHRRGYRKAGVEAPLKETLAAGIVLLAEFSSDFPPTAVLLDPMCGSGTLLIEAAMIYGDSAPGLQRKSFGFMSWKRHDARLWEKLVDEAVTREEQALGKPWPQLIGYEADPRAVKAARQNIGQPETTCCIETTIGRGVAAGQSPLRRTVIGSGDSTLPLPVSGPKNKAGVVWLGCGIFFRQPRSGRQHGHALDQEFQAVQWSHQMQTALRIS